MQKRADPQDSNSAPKPPLRLVVRPEGRVGTIRASQQALIHVLNREQLSLGPDGRIVAEEDVTRYGIDVLLPTSTRRLFWRSEIGKKEARRRIDEFRGANDGIFPNLAELKAIGLWDACEMNPRLGDFFFWLGYSREEFIASNAMRLNGRSGSVPRKEVRDPMGHEEMGKGANVSLDIEGTLPHTDGEPKEADAFSALGYPRMLMGLLMEAKRQTNASRSWAKETSRARLESKGAGPNPQDAPDNTNGMVNTDEIPAAAQPRSLFSDLWTNGEIVEEAARRYAAFVEKHGRKPNINELKRDPVLSGVLSGYTESGLTVSDLRYRLESMMSNLRASGV